MSILKGQSLMLLLLQEDVGIMLERDILKEE